MRRITLLLVICMSACETNMMTGQPIWGFAPLTASDGSKTWRFVGPWRLNSSAIELDNAISVKMGEVHWCPNGWEVSSREKHAGLLVVTGRCKSG
jgi:hypothetical protein